MSSSVSRLPEAPSARWLTLVGLGADGVLGLSPVARAAIAEAPLVVGSARQLALVRELCRAETLTWPTPFVQGIAQVLSRRGLSTCVLASGDPFFFGVGATLSRHVPAHELRCYPAPSSLSLAAARLGWPLQELDVVSLHGRELHGVLRALQPGRRLLVLSWDERTPGQLAQLLCQRGFGESTLHVMEELGGPAERIRSGPAQAFAWADVSALNLVALELVAAPGAQVLPVRGSLPDHLFEHDGQLTKQDIRALTMSALSPRAGELLWDIGAGAGSIAIEWLLSHPANRAIAVESQPQRCARIQRNARELGVPALQVVQSQAPAGLADLSTPHAVFIGGGSSDAQLVTSCLSALPSGGRLVMNAVALETEAQLALLYKAHGGELRRFSVERAEPLGGMRGFRPAMSVTQWRYQKP